MKFWKIGLAIAATGVLAACGSNTETQETDTDKAPATSAGDTAPEAAEPEIELTDIAKKGKVVFLKCRSCHTVKEGDVHLTGPNLHGLIGAPAGKKDGYAFSEALASAGISWTDENLDKWVEAPKSVAPGNKMVFAGLPKAEEREALIAYLKEVTK